MNRHILILAFPALILSCAPCQAAETVLRVTDINAGTDLYP
jgi:hypothetical protein